MGEGSVENPEFFLTYSMAGPPAQGGIKTIHTHIIACEGKLFSTLKVIVTVKQSGRFFQIFVALSEYLNFIEHMQICGTLLLMKGFQPNIEMKLGIDLVYKAREG